MSLTQNTLKLALPMAMSLALAACGGSSSSDGSSGKIGFGSNSTPEVTTTTNQDTPVVAATDDDTSTDETTTEQSKVNKLLVYSSATILGSDSSISDPALIYMMAKDSNNIALSNISFSPSVDNGATLFSGDVSDDGTLTTWKLVPEEPKNQTITVSVTANGITESVNVEVIGTTIEIDGASSISINTPTTYTVKLKDAAGTGLAQQQVSLKSELLTSTRMTDAQGEAQFEIQPTIGNDYELEVSALGATDSKTITASSNTFNLTTSTNEIAVETNQPITLAWTANGTPQSGKVIYLSATRGQISSNGTEVGQVTTAANGTATFDISSSTAGGTVITATNNTTNLTTSLPLEFVSTTPKYLNIQAAPSIIAPLGTSSIIAQVKDINDNPVKNQIVVFNLNDTVDGKLSSSKATTNSAGKASIVYTAGNATSALEGVVITSHIEGVPKTAAEATSGQTFVEEDTTKLTVGGDAVRIAFGFDELITENSPYYGKTFGVIVTDNAGNPVAGKQIDFTVTSTGYSKGSLAYDDINSRWGYATTPNDCAAEDLDKDGLLDYDDFHTEDFNNSGELEPTNAASISGSGTTDSLGQATAQISYLQNYAWWERVSITATVTVNGTEYKSTIENNLDALAADMTAETSPPNAVSPYGTGLCTEPQ